ncbi:MAG: oligosaccharide flippase family protein, partial [Bacteroidota bacterium]
MLVRAIVWSYAGKIIRQIGTFGVSIVLARLLAPEEFGAAGIVLALIAMVNVIVDFGFGGALLQRKDFDDKLASSIFYFSVFVGLVMFTIAQFGARYIAEIYSLPELEDAIRLMAISFVITPLLGVLQIKMEKALRFDLIVKQLLPASLISGLGAILAAFLEYGVLSLIIQNLLLNVSLTFFLWKKERWLPRHRFATVDAGDRI